MADVLFRLRGQWPVRQQCLRNYALPPYLFTYDVTVTWFCLHLTKSKLGLLKVVWNFVGGGIIYKILILIGSTKMIYILIRSINPNLDIN